MVEEIFNEAREHMQKSIDVMKKDFLTLRTGKVTTAIVDSVRVNYYGNPTPLNQVASVTTLDATTIAINPWDKSMLGEIEKAIQQANIGVNPNNDGDFIKLFFPPMTTEQREEIAKQAKAMAEKAKIAVRNVRKEANNKIKRLEKDKSISEDEAKRALDTIQKITDEHIAKIDEALKSKEADIKRV
jgi:ribosome recycling factor